MRHPVQQTTEQWWQINYIQYCLKGRPSQQIKTSCGEVI